MIDFHSQLAIIPEVYDTATLQDNLEHSGGISLSWKSKTDDEIPLGSYLTYGGTRYVLMQPYAPSKESPVHYHYNPTFKHPQALFDFTPFWIKSKDAEDNDINLRTTSYTGFPYVIAQKLVNFMAEYANEMQDTFFAETIGLTKDANNQWQPTWTFNIPQVVDGEGRVIDPHTIITVAFDGSSIKGAADSIATAMGCNVFFDWSSKTIRFVAGTTIQGESYNCFHVLGGTTNMGKNTASGSFAAITQRLTLDETLFHGSIIKRGAALTQGGIMLTKELIFDDIYPKMELYIKGTHERECYLTNEEGDFIVDHFDANEEPVYKTYSKWYISLSKDAAGTIPYNFNQSTLIDDKPLGLLFQLDYKNPEHMSALVGRQFEMTYFPETTKEWDKTDVERDYSQAWEVPAGWFRIALVAEGDVLLPTSSGNGLYPQAGDKVTLVNVALTDEKSTAQEELLAAALEIIGLMETPAGEYTETVILGKEVNGRTINSIVIGQETPFEAGVPAEQRKHGPVVTQINHNLDTDVADVTVGSWTRKTRSGGTSDKLETVTVSANSSTNGGDNYSNGSIGEGGGYGGNSTETLNQTTLKPDSLFVASLSNTIDAVSCDASGKVRIASDIYTKIDGHYGTKDVTASCIVSVPSLPEDQSQTIGVHLKPRIYIGTTPYDTENPRTETEITAINYGYELTDAIRWLRINMPLGYDMNELNDTYTQLFSVEHPAYKERQCDFVVNAMRDGANGLNGPFKSRVFCRFNPTAQKSAPSTPTGGDYNHPWPGGETPHTATDGVVWYDGIPGGTAQIWSSVATFTVNGGSPTWSTPQPESDTANIDIEFSPNINCPADPTGDDPNVDNTSARNAQGWYDPLKNASTQGVDWSAMIWRAERKVANGVYNGGWTKSRIKGEQGAPAGNTATIFLYKRGASVADVWGDTTTASTKRPNRTLYYEFSSKKLYATKSGETLSDEVTNSNADTYTNGWCPQMPSGTGRLFVTAATAYNTKSYDDIASGEWADPVQYNGDDGQPGADGFNTATIFVYKRAASVNDDFPFNGTVYYKFADGELYTDDTLTTKATFNTGWSRNIPATDAQHNPCWVRQAVALSQEEFDAIIKAGGDNDWSDPAVKMVEDGKSITKSSEVNKYAVSASGTTTPSTWYNSKQDAINAYTGTTGGEWPKNTYMWTETTITWSDTSTTVLYGVERNPNDGKSGQDVVIESQSVQYSKKSSGNIDPTTITDWGDYPSSLSKGDWLYSKTTVVYKTSTGTAAGTTVSYSVSYIGMDGAEGRALTGLTEHYLASDKNYGEQGAPTTPTSAANEWTTDPNVPDQQGVSQWNADHPYLWNYEKTTYSKGTTVERTPARVIAIWTEDGNNGKGVDSITNFYKKSNQSTGVGFPSADPDGGGDAHSGGTETGWNSAVQVPDATDPYLWNYERITWIESDESYSYTYTNPHVIGHFGKDGTSVLAQYSVDGSTNWHKTFAAGDMYMRTSTDGGTTWGTAMKIVGEDGDPGKDGDYTVFSFNISDLETGVDGNTAYPTHLGYQTWQDAPPATTSTMKYLWCKEVRHTFVNGVDTPGTASYFRITGEKGPKGDGGQSSFKSTVFCRVNATPTKPTNGNYASPSPSDVAWTDGTTTIYWSNGIPSGDAKLWASTRIFTSDGQSPQQSAWSNPCQMTDTADFDVEFSSVANNPGNPTDNPSNWSNAASSNTIWMATRECHNGSWSAWQVAKVKGEKGEDGKDAISPIYAYCDYVFGEDYQGHDRPEASETTVGLIDLIQYSSTSNDMIDVGIDEGGGSYSWDSESGLPIGRRYMLRGTNKVYRATENGWVLEGEMVVVASLDNQHEDFIYDDAGNRKSAVVTSQARLYEGSIERTTNCTWSIDSNGTSGVVLNDSTSPYYASINASTGVLTVNGINSATAKVKVRAEYPTGSGKYYYAQFTSNKTTQDKYEISLTPNSIPFNEANYSAQTISISAKRYSIDGSAANLAFGSYNDKSKISTDSSKGYLRLFATMNIKSGQQWISMLVRVTSATMSVSKDSASHNTNIIFNLYKYSDPTIIDPTGTPAGQLVDTQTIPITKAFNGNNGDAGNYYLDEYGRASTRELNASGVPDGLDTTLGPDHEGYDNGWQLTAPEATTTYPYIWKRSRLWNPNTGTWDDDSSWAYVCETGKQGPEGDDAPFEVRDYALGNSYTTHPTGVTWQATAPDRTVGTFVWMRIRSFNGGDDPATATPQNTSYVCITGDPGQNGGTGHAGRWYDYDGVWGVDTLSVTNTANVGYYVLYYYNGTSKHFYMNTMDDGVANTTTPADSSGVANSGWEQIQDDREYYIVKAIFGDYAQFGSFIINGDWMISTNGTIDGVAYNNGALYNGRAAYTYFDEDNPNTNTGSNFIPNFAIDGLTGETYQNLAHVRGEIEAESGHIGGFVIGSTTLKDTSDKISLDSANQKISVGGVELLYKQNFQSGGYEWSGIAAKDDIGYDTVAIGMRKYENDYGGHISLRGSSGSKGGYFDVTVGGNAQQSKVEMAPANPVVGNQSNIVIDASSKNQNTASITVQNWNTTQTDKSVIKPNEIITPKVNATSITTTEVKTTSGTIPIALPHNVVLCTSTSYTLPSNPTKGAFVFFKSLVNVTINIASGEKAEIYESQGSKLYSSISIGGEAAIFVFDGTNWILFLSH